MFYIELFDWYTGHLFQNLETEHHPAEHFTPNGKNNYSNPVIG